MISAEDSIGPPTHDDPRVVRALEEYLVALEAGCPPDRHEFLRRHADVAGPLAECLEGLECVHAASPTPHPSGGGRGSALLTPPSEGRPGVLGEFRLLREVGRGGMGVVYEAEQITLGRRVALKVLPFAASLDDRHLQRFKNEAQAAAHLHHQHIVPVYAVGCDRGVHYYAMQFIDGQTLAALIADLRRLADPAATEHETPSSERARQLAAGHWQPAATPAPADSATAPVTPAAGPLTTERPAAGPAFFRTVANLGAQAAEAVDYAHQMGIVHRDVKPANLLVDARGYLWVTDFGLAHIQTDVRLTMTGDLVGTLRYMSPEQALAHGAILDHRTDVYSLGATLYELLTLRPAFGGRDRQELLRQIAFEEPISPRRLNRAIPAELETVVLKAMAKSPEDRYSTARALAEDLRRFLDDRPIHARPPTLRDRARKFIRRHRSAVTSLAISTGAALVLGAAVSTWQAVRATRAEYQAREEQLRAEAAAERARQKAREAENERRRVDLSLELAMTLMALDPGMNEMRKSLERGRTDPRILIEFAKRSLREAPTVEHRWKLLAVAYEAAGEHAEALTYFEEAIRTRPEVPSTHNRLAWLLAMCEDVRFRDPPRAVAAAEHTIKLDSKTPWFWNTLGAAYYRDGQWRKAIEALDKSCSLGWDDGFNSFFLAMAHWQLGDRDQARRWYDLALQKQKSAIPIAGAELRRIRAEAEELLRIENGNSGAEPRDPSTQ